MLTAARRNTQNGVYDIHTNAMFYPASMQPTHARIEQVANTGEPADASNGTESTIFTPLKPIVSRNYLVQDIHMETPPAGVSQASYDVPFRHSTADRAAVYQSDFLAPFRGLGAVPDDVKELLPPECRKAFDEALHHEEDWHARWGNEADNMSRGKLVIDKAIVPYSMSL